MTGSGGDGRAAGSAARGDAASGDAASGDAAGGDAAGGDAASGDAAGASRGAGGGAAGGGAAGAGASRAEVCVVACAEAWRGDGAILASPMGLIPSLGARLAQLTFAPELLVTDGEAMLVGAGAGEAVEGWLPYRDVLRLVATGRRHMMMGAAQLDRYGNQNISCIGDWARPRAQLLGVRGAPGNTVNHPVSYWIPRHSRRVFVPRVDMVSGVGYDRAARLSGPAAAFHELRLVVTDRAVLDFAGPGHAMRLRSVHPGVTVAEVRELTGFELAIPENVPVTRPPTPAELALIRERLDAGGLRERELA